MKISLILFFVCCFLGLQAQTNFLPGVIITNEGDTLHGLLDYRSVARNAHKCEFMQEGSDNVQEFLPFSIKGYRFKDGKYFVSREVDVNGKKTPLFLEYLVHGICDLYFFGDGIWYHYFLEKADGQLFELTNEEKKVQLNGKTYLRSDKKYIGVMKYAFADCPQLMPMINRAELNHESLIDIVKKYHELMCDDFRCILYQKQLPAVRVKLGASVGLHSSFLEFNNNDKMECLDFGTTYYPALEVMLNTALPRVSEKLSLQLSGEISGPNFHGTGFYAPLAANEDLKLNILLLKGKAGLQYTWPKGRFRPTILVGGHYARVTNTDARFVQVSIYENNVYTSETKDVPLPKIMKGLNAELGINCVSKSSMIPFLKLGIENSNGTSDLLFSKKDDLHLTTIKLHAGIYF